MKHEEVIALLQCYRLKYPVFDYSPCGSLELKLQEQSVNVYIEEGHLDWVKQEIVGCIKAANLKLVQERSLAYENYEGGNLPFIKDYDHLGNLHKIIKFFELERQHAKTSERAEEIV